MSTILDDRDDSTHMVEIVDVATVNQMGKPLPSAEIEKAYKKLSERAQATDSIIVSLVQTVNVYVGGSGPRVVVTIIAQKIGRAELEEQQRRAMLAGMTGPQGSRRVN